MGLKEHNNKKLNYSDYLNLDKILNNQDLKSKVAGKESHDEMLFIVIHQVYELWFKQILHELDSVLKIFGKDDIHESKISLAVLRLDRVIEIQKILIDQIRVLETMTAMDFLEFRDYLFPSSGFQSAQFRLIENKLGLPVNRRLKYGIQEYKNVLAIDQIKVVKEREEANSLFRLIERWLERTPFLFFKGFNFWEQYTKSVLKMLDEEEIAIKNNPNHSADDIDFHLKEHSKASSSFEALINSEIHDKLISQQKKRLSHKATQAALLIFLYRDEPILHSPFNLLSRLMTVDELLTTWRQRHSLMVRRMIGVKIGTGGSSGHSYLQATAEKHKVFSELTDLSTFFIPRSALPNLPENIKINLGYHYKP